MNATKNRTGTAKLKLGSIGQRIHRHVQESRGNAADALEVAAGAPSGPALRLSLRTPLSDGRGAVIAQLLVENGGINCGIISPLLQKV